MPCTKANWSVPHGSMLTFTLQPWLNLRGRSPTLSYPIGTKGLERKLLQVHWSSRSIQRKTAQVFTKNKIVSLSIEIRPQCAISNPLRQIQHYSSVFLIHQSQRFCNLEKKKPWQPILHLYPKSKRQDKRNNFFIDLVILTETILFLMLKIDSGSWRKN